MKANELRIGNIVMYDNYNISIVHGITDSNYGNGIHVHFCNTCVGCAEEMIEPIPLTEEWMIKFEWEIIRGDTFIFLDINYFSIDISGHLYYMNDYTAVNIEYVHQLQNLYFALTGEELTLKS